LLVCLVGILVASCGGDGGPGSAAERTVTVTATVFTTPGETIAVPSEGPLTRDGFRQLAAGLRKIVGRDPLVFEVYLYETHASFEVYDRTTGFTDDYDWTNGAFEPPDPVKRSRTDVDRELFALEEVALDGPFRFISGVAEIRLAGAESTSPAVRIARAFISGDEPGPIQMSASLSGTRQDAYITGDSRGRIIDTQIN
jgi:hypothetical protein